MSNNKNPYTSDHSYERKAPQNTDLSSHQDNKKNPKISQHKGIELIPKVIGILSIVYGIITLVKGVIGVLGTLFIYAGIQNSEWQALDNFGYNDTYIIGILGLSVISILMAIWAILIGIKLIKYLDKGRRQFNYYTLVTIFLSIASFYFSRYTVAKMIESLSSETSVASAETMDMSPLAYSSAFIVPIIVIILSAVLNKKSTFIE